MKKSMQKFQAAFFLACTFGVAGAAFADVDTITGLGSTRLSACTDAKQSAVRVTMPYNFRITSYGSCDCEQSSENLWKCSVEYRYVYKDRR